MRQGEHVSKETGPERARKWELFLGALDRGDVVAALTSPPFGYRSRLVEGGFEFTILDGAMRGQVGKAERLIDAVWRAVDLTGDVRKMRVPASRIERSQSEA
jgi:hypothetical protein